MPVVVVIAIPPYLIIGMLRNYNLIRVEIVGEGLLILNADRDDDVLPPIRNHGGFFVSWIQKYDKRREDEERGE